MIRYLHGEEQLFNLAEDPQELNSVLADHPEKAEVFRTRMEEARDAYDELGYEVGEKFWKSVGA